MYVCTATLRGFACNVAVNVKSDKIIAPVSNSFFIIIVFIFVSFNSHGKVIFYLLVCL